MFLTRSSCGLSKITNAKHSNQGLAAWEMLNMWDVPFWEGGYSWSCLSVSETGAHTPPGSFSGSHIRVLVVGKGGDAWPQEPRRNRANAQGAGHQCLPGLHVWIGLFQLRECGPCVYVILILLNQPFPRQFQG